MAAVAAAAAATGGYDDDDRQASSRVIRLAAGGDAWRGGPAGTPVHRSGAMCAYTHLLTYLLTYTTATTCESCFGSDAYECPDDRTPRHSARHTAGPIEGARAILADPNGLWW